jgi:hypothetical protein
MFKMFKLKFLPIVAIVASLGSCSSDDEPFRKPTFPVVGKVTVDGAAPTSAVQVQCHAASSVDSEHPTFSQTETKEDGSFEISTYESGDGVPEGEYVLTFVWQEFNLFNRSYSGPDKLNNRYADPKTSEIKVTVKSGEPTDLGEIKLTTK